MEFAEFLRAFTACVQLQVAEHANLKNDGDRLTFNLAAVATEPQGASTDADNWNPLEDAHAQTKEDEKQAIKGMRNAGNTTVKATNATALDDAMKPLADEVGKIEADKVEPPEQRAKFEAEWNARVNKTVTLAYPFKPHKEGILILILNHSELSELSESSKSLSESLSESSESKSSQNLKLQQVTKKHCSSVKNWKKISTVNGQAPLLHVKTAKSSAG